LHDFQSFRFRGEGILCGRRAGTSGEIRMFAYCGGQVQGKGKCGYAPLLIGQEKTCSQCDYLVCPRCKSCRADCLAKARRG
jgi:hypothetical protein